MIVGHDHDAPSPDQRVRCVRISHDGRPPAVIVAVMCDPPPDGVHGVRDGRVDLPPTPHPIGYRMGNDRMEDSIELPGGPSISCPSIDGVSRACHTFGRAGSCSLDDGR